MIVNTSCRRLFRASVLYFNQSYSKTYGSNVRQSSVLQNVNKWRLCQINNQNNKQWRKDYSCDKTTRGCWSCGKEVGRALFCSECQSVQKPPENASYFQVLGLDEKFEIDETQLSKTYKEMQKMLHPDKFSNRNETEQSISAEYSSLVNKAYNVLMQPLSRGTYMLELRGIQIPEQTQVESAFLHEIMERNEQVEEAETEEEILKLHKDIKEVLRGQANELGESLKHKNDVKSKEMLIRMKYYTSIETQLKESIRKMGIVL